MSKPKLQNVAEEARVSLTTASLALSGKGKISTAVRQRVAEAARRIGYRRREARAPAAPGVPQTATILMPVDDTWAHIFYFIRPIIVEIERSLIREGFYPVLLPTFYSSDAEDMVAKILANEAKAVFSIHYGNEKLFRELEDRGIPVVVVMNNNFQDTLYSVCVDDFQGAYEGCLHLLRLGHTSIGYVDYPRPELPAIVVDRFFGFRKALEEFSIQFNPDLRLTAELQDRGALRSGLGALFSRGDKPTALFVHDDYFAVRVVEELSTMGLRVPRDVSIIAPGDVLDYGEPFVPQITTMRINTALMGQISADLIINRLRRNPDDIHVLKVKQQLVDRGSCRRIG
jgi:LacI family transcriptional regulator, galactose operon repressor